MSKLFYEVYLDFAESYENLEYLAERIIVSHFNETVDHINDVIIIPTEDHVYLSCDCIIDVGIYSNESTI